MSSSSKPVPCPHHPGYTGCCKPPSVTVLPMAPPTLSTGVGWSGNEEPIVGSTARYLRSVEDALVAEQAHADRLAEALAGICPDLAGPEEGGEEAEGPCWLECSEWPHKPACEAARAVLAAHREARRD